MTRHQYSWLCSHKIIKNSCMFLLPQREILSFTKFKVQKIQFFQSLLSFVFSIYTILICTNDNLNMEDKLKFNLSQKQSSKINKDLVIFPCKC